MDGIRSRTTLVLTLLAFAGGAPHAFAADPATDYAVGSAPMQAAQQIAHDYWSADPCGSQVAISWMQLSSTTNATSTWTNPIGQYDAPSQNTSCAIAFNTTVSWDWNKFCSVLVHEYGHLLGHPHSEDANDLMYAYYVKPLDQCAASPLNVPVAPPASTDPAPAPVAGSDSTVAPDPAQVSALRSTPTASAARHRGGRGMLVVVREPRRTHHHAIHRHHRLHHRTHHRLRHHSARWQQLMARYRARHRH